MPVEGLVGSLVNDIYASNYRSREQKEFLAVLTRFIVFLWISRFDTRAMERPECGALRARLCPD
jgi:hypothetical protein